MAGTRWWCPADHRRHWRGQRNHEIGYIYIYIISVYIYINMICNYLYNISNSHIYIYIWLHSTIYIIKKTHIYIILIYIYIYIYTYRSCSHWTLHWWVIFHGLIWWHRRMPKNKPFQRIGNGKKLWASMIGGCPVPWQFKRGVRPWNMFRYLAFDQ